MDNFEENVMTSKQHHEVNTELAYLKYDENMNPSSDSLTKYEIGRSFYQLGKVHYDKSALNVAEENFLKAYACCEHPKDIFSMFKVLGFLIRIYSERLDNEKANKYIAIAEDLVTDLTSVLGSLNAEYFYNLGVIKNYKGNFEEAKTNFELAYKRAKEENEPDLLAKCLLSYASTCYNLKEFELAKENLEQLEQLLTIVKKSYLRGSMNFFLGKVYLEMDMFDKALECLSRANQNFQEKKCWNLFGYVLLWKGNVYKRMGDYDKALLFFEMVSEVVDLNIFKRLESLVETEILDVKDSSVDIYLDRVNRKINEKTLGTIDFKHRFVLLEILFLLAKNCGSYFDKEQLAKLIWKDEYNPLIHDKLIYTSVSRLRKLIEPKNDKNTKRKYIIRGKDGYTFNPNVKIRFHMEERSTIDRPIANVELSSPV